MSFAAPPFTFMFPADILRPTRDNSDWFRSTERDSCSTGPVGVLVKLQLVMQTATPTSNANLWFIRVPPIRIRRGLTDCSVSSFPQLHILRRIPLVNDAIK